MTWWVKIEYRKCPYREPSGDYVYCSLDSDWNSPLPECVEWACRRKVR